MPATKTQGISKIQRIQLNLLRESSFNDFDGKMVGDSLMEHRDLWIAFLLDRECYGAASRMNDQREKIRKGEPAGLPICPIDTIRLRDLADGYWNVDALFVLPAPGKEDSLELLARRDWRADEIDWCDPLDAGSVWVYGNKKPKIGEQPQVITVEKMLRVWWD